MKNIYALLTSQLLIGAAFAAGAKAPSAEPKPNDPAPARTLKKKVEIGKVGTKSFLLPDGTSFDLVEAMTAQLGTALVSSNLFAIKAPSQSGSDCEADMAQYKVDGETIGFEMDAKTGVTLGYSPKETLNMVTISASAEITRSRLYLLMYGSHPLSDKLLASSQVDGKRNETKVNARIDFQGIGLGVTPYFKTPLAKVSEKALQLGVAALAAQTAAQSWQSTVVLANGEFVALAAGADAGLKAGDQFRVQNQTHFWRGERCASEYQGSLPDSAGHALVEVTEVGSNESWARVLEYRDHAAVRPGARVSVSKLAP